MEAFPWAPRSPRRGRAPAPMALVPRARYVSAPGPAHPPPFSSWRDYLGLATLITKAVGGSPPASPCCSPRAGAEPGPQGAPEDDGDDGGDDGDDDGPGSRGRGLGGALELRALELCAAPAPVPVPAPAPLEERFAELSPFAGRAAAWAPEPPPHAAPGPGPGPAAARLLRPELQVCVFCRNNKEAVALYTTHILKGPDGRVLCPVLRRYTCPLCGASGDNAHTIKYCPLSRAPAPPRSARDGPPGKRLR